MMYSFQNVIKDWKIADNCNCDAAHFATRVRQFCVNLLKESFRDETRLPLAGKLIKRSPFRAIAVG